MRLQSAAAQLPEKNPERDRLDTKAAAIFQAHGWKWYDRPTQPPGWKAGWHELFRQFDRGVLTELRIPGRLVHLVADLPGLFAGEPVGTIVFDAVGVRASHLRAVRRLAVPPRPVGLTFRRLFHNGDPVGYLVAAVTALFATAAVSIDAAGYAGGLEVVQAVTRSPFLANLRELVLDGNRLDAVAALALARSRGLGRLERLMLRGEVPWSRDLEVLRERFGERLLV